jgi:hypothetical protein
VIGMRGSGVLRELGGGSYMCEKNLFIDGFGLHIYPIYIIVDFTKRCFLAKCFFFFVVLWVP